MSARVRSEDHILSHWLRETRAELGVTQTRVAQLMQRRGWKWHQQTVLKIEGNLRPVTFGEAVALSYALGVALPQPPDELEQLCPACLGGPPEGFTCNACGESA